MKKYNLINNSLGWLCFVIAAVTYLLTLEPTASFWDCPEFISQGYKLEVGHPPGNPIFMLAARFFVNFAFGDVSKVALMVNSMSALLSAGTILLLFWTITHLVRKLIVKDDASEISLTQMLVIFGSGICGALAYTWSDTFWFSAVEGEVYAFSSFCTALVFWLILKWENRAERPHSDKYLIFIAYIIGISIAVHLLNLLCIPAIALVIYYKLWKDTTAKGSLVTLALSAVVVGLILYGLVPGFIEVSQYFELFFVNTLGCSYNMGVLIYAILAVACFIWAISELYKQNSVGKIRISVLLSIFFSGIPFIGESMWIPVIIMIGLIAWLFMAKKLPVRILNLVVMSIFVIFIGYSSYALLLIRASANPPMNQNAPDNVFALASYLNREQYGERPLFYGQTHQSSVVYEIDGQGQASPMYDEGRPLYAKVVKTSPDQPDRYEITGYKKNYVMAPELNMLFPRIYSGAHTAAYSDWIGGLKGKPVSATRYVHDGETLQTVDAIKPTMGESLRFFLVYQLNHMYWRYFMWNFAGRQNDIQGNGEVNHGNWISGIPFIDNPRLGDQSLLPYSDGKGNKGHNVFYMLPLIMGIIGLGWQAFTSKRGIEQFWVIFFLFFMTGIAIVLYLNQTPSQPRERDYAFAGSFYAFAIWLGMGVAGLWALVCELFRKNGKDKGKAALSTEAAEAREKKISLAGAIFACLVGLFVPLQMVSQTWDDHDRSGRYTTRDFGMNYLDSVDENGIIFTNGDNDTFPLWYAQEVEGHRTDVKVVNLSYLTTDWYANQVKHPSYQAEGIETLAKPEDYGYERMNFSYFAADCDTTPVNIFTALRQVYDQNSSKNTWNAPMMKYNNFVIPVDIPAAVKAGRITEHEAEAADTAIRANMADDRESSGHGGMTLSQILSLDMLATSVKNGWKNPIYFASTVPSDYYVALQPYMRSTGMAYEVTPVRNEENGEYDINAVNTDKAYRNITEKFRWGGLENVTSPDDIYLDETIRRMVTTTRSYIIATATAFINEAALAERADTITADPEAKQELAAYKADRYAKALELLNLMEEKLPEAASPYAVQIPQKMAQIYARIGMATSNKEASAHALELLENEIRRYAQNVKYYQSLNPWQYATLPKTDRFIETYYMVYLLQDLSDAGGDAEKMVDELTDMGVNFDRIVSILQQ
ncbi:MAG: DUF2723 domain-containing protein [Duncaniella sp.]|uniref:glycosyltransferase family 117 protein n=1 Tax=Duncaniella sp. TaxID=2518496 RepID=UPI0023C1C93B|nr:DUF2723 domain-containing protein [Duncaniella sp.]MDE6091083.1 DUF2723 domain-containing protein [Duncaniella sp.]